MAVLAAARPACNIRTTLIAPCDQLKRAAAERLREANLAARVAVKDASMSRAAAIARAHAYFDSGECLLDLQRRVAISSTSQEPERAPALSRSLDGGMGPSVAAV